MSVELERQLHEYCHQVDEAQGALSADDILERSGELPTIRGLPDRRPSLRRRWIAIAATAGLVIVMVIAGVRSLPTPDRVIQPTDQPTPTSTVVPRTDFPESGPVEAGTYHLEPSPSTVAGVTLTFPAAWETQYGLPAAFKAPDEDAFFDFYTVGMISSDTCQRADGTTVGPSVGDLALALVDLANTSATGPIDTTFGGLPAKQVDLSIAEGFDATDCNAPGGLQIWYSQPADNYFVLLDDHTASVYILDVDGERQVFVTQVRNGASDEDIAELQAIIGSIRFDQ